jgi:hypothetical protein
MFRVKIVAFLARTSDGTSYVRAANRKSSKYVYVDNHFVEKDLPHYRPAQQPSYEENLSELENSSSWSGGDFGEESVFSNYYSKTLPVDEANGF